MSAAADQILAIDCGTQSLRALVVDPRGEIVAKVRVPYEPYVSPQPGWAEQDPEVWWRALGEASRRVLADPAVRPAALAGVALTTQRASIVVVDAAGDPVRPAIVWLDQRRTGGLRPVGGATGLAFRALGVRETVAAFQADAEVNWIRRYQPEVWARTAGYLFVSGFLTRRLVGRSVDSVGCQVGYVPFDYKRLAWSAPGDWKWTVAPIDPAMLPQLIPPGGRLGEISAAAAEATGIPAGLPLIAAAADQACEVLGAGALDPTVGALSYGTTATINTTQVRYVEAIPLVPPYPAALPGAYNLELTVTRGFWMVEWFKREFGDREVARAAGAGVEPEVLFDDLVRAVPPGSMGLTLQPFWSPGIRIPGPEAKGAIIGWGDVHTRAHLYRAILEGLAYALREGAERTEQRTKVKIRELRVSGGGSQSPAAVQLTADVFGLPTGRPHTYETAGLGAAIVAAVGLGIHPTFEAAVGAMTRVAEVRDPDPATPRALRRALSQRLSADVSGAQADLRCDPPDHRLPADGLRLGGFRLGWARFGGRRRWGGGRRCGRVDRGTRCVRVLDDDRLGAGEEEAELEVALDPLDDVAIDPGQAVLDRTAVGRLHEHQLDMVEEDERAGRPGERASRVEAGHRRHPAGHEVRPADQHDVVPGRVDDDRGVGRRHDHEQIVGRDADPGARDPAIGGDPSSGAR